MGLDSFNVFFPHENWPIFRKIGQLFNRDGNFNGISVSVGATLRVKSCEFKEKFCFFLGCPLEAKMGGGGGRGEEGWRRERKKDRLTYFI